VLANHLNGDEKLKGGRNRLASSFTPMASNQRAQQNLLVKKL
jgi:hypothetical protein